MGEASEAICVKIQSYITRTQSKRIQNPFRRYHKPKSWLLIKLGLIQQMNERCRQISIVSFPIRMTEEMDAWTGPRCSVETFSGFQCAKGFAEAKMKIVCEIVFIYGKFSVTGFNWNMCFYRK